MQARHYPRRQLAAEGTFLATFVYAEVLLAIWIGNPSP